MSCADWSEHTLALLYGASTRDVEGNGAQPATTRTEGGSASSTLEPAVRDDDDTYMDCQMDTPIPSIQPRNQPSLHSFWTSVPRDTVLGSTGIASPCSSRSSSESVTSPARRVPPCIAVRDFGFEATRDGGLDRTEMLGDVDMV